jgi:hypothetical protein
LFQIFPPDAESPGNCLLIWTNAAQAKWHFFEEGAMPLQVAHGAILRCSMGLAPSSLQVLPVRRVTAGGMQAATILDHTPMVNTLPFGMCTSPANPAVAAATTAALGVLTPMPCMPATPAPWTPGAPTVLIGSAPALDNNCRLACLWAGMIEVVSVNQLTVTIP